MSPGSLKADLAGVIATGRRSMAAEATMKNEAQFRQWAETLREFTYRNAGRRTVLEVDAPEFGAQAEEFDYPLRGVAYDPRDGRVQIMLGEQCSVEQHLTHSMVAPESIDILADHGRDRALRIVHEDGQTLLRFVEP
jgi:hypothetical protein